MTHSPLQAARQFWLELFNERAMEAMLERMDPQYVQRDHRAADPGGASRDDWQALMQSWWERVPDVAAVDFGLAGLQGEYVAYRVRFNGSDGVSEFFVVNCMREGRFLTADIFGGRDVALVWLKNEAYSRS